MLKKYCIFGDLLVIFLLPEKFYFCHSTPKVLCSNLVLSPSESTRLSRYAFGTVVAHEICWQTSGVYCSSSSRCILRAPFIHSIDLYWEPAVRQGLCARVCARVHHSLKNDRKALWCCNGTWVSWGLWIFCPGFVNQLRDLRHTIGPSLGLTITTGFPKS